MEIPDIYKDAIVIKTSPVIMKTVTENKEKEKEKKDNEDKTTTDSVEGFPLDASGNPIKTQMLDANGNPMTDSLLSN
jgi:Mn-containing catalase